MTTTPALMVGLSPLQAEFIATIAKYDRSRAWMMQYLPPEYQRPIKRSFVGRIIGAGAALTISLAILALIRPREPGAEPRGTAAG